MVLVMSEAGHATNTLAVDLARENDRLTARVAELEAQLAALTPATITLSGRVIDLVSGLIRRDGKILGRLTRTERAIVAALAAAPGVAVPYGRIRDVAWPGAYQEGEALQHALRVNLSRIRAKLDDRTLTYSGACNVGGTVTSRHFFVVGGYGAGITE
jgi:DNA-binding response OmpR family regulator